MKFGSSERLSGYENLNFNPGPGHYNSKSHVAHSQTKPKGQKIDPRAGFGQTSGRFDGIVRNEVDLGPGYYFGQKEWQSKKTYKQNKAQFYPNPRKIITIPSIPSSTHAMGYVEREDGYLIPLNGSSVKEEHDLGPGTYDANDATTKKKVQGFSLNRMTSPRFPAEKNLDEQKNRITLGNYTLPKREITETEPEPKKPDPPKKVYVPKDEVVIAQKKSDENPGLTPGYYYNEKNASSFNIAQKALEFQNFGSTAKRFESAAAGKPVVGPGSYNPSAPGASRAPYMKVEPYSKGELRFKSTGLEDLPGPGTYVQNSYFTSNTEINWSAQTNFPSAFGSGATRFETPKTVADLPGPGSYNPFRVKKNKKKRTKPGVNSMIHSTTTQQAALPDFSKDLAYAADLDLGGRSKGAVIVKHEAPANRGTSAFQSVGQRFVQEKDKRSMTPGPGSYDWNQAKVGVKPTHNTLKTTFSLTPRGYESKVEIYKKNLGPGIYDYKVDIVKPKINYAPKINPMVPAYGALLP